MSRHRRVVVSCLAAVLLAAPAARADASVPLFVPVQGRLLDGADQPVNAQVSLTYSIYDLPETPTGSTPAPPLWSGTYQVSVTNGVYALQLGDTTTGQKALPVELFDGSAARWLGVAVNAGTELKPRLRVASVPHAFLAQRALRADDAKTLMGEAPASFHDASRLTGLAPAAVLGNGAATIATVGTVTTGTWNATPVEDAYVKGAAAWSAKLDAVAHDGSLSGDGKATPLAVRNVTNEMLAQSSVTVTAGTGLTGGGAVALGAETTLSLANVPTVTPGSYTHPTLTIDAHGRVTAAASGTVTSGTVTSVGAGAGLTGGPITAGGSLAIATNGVTNAMLSGDAASLAKVSGGAMTTNGTNVGIGVASPSAKLEVSGPVVAPWDGSQGSSENHAFCVGGSYIYTRHEAAQQCKARGMRLCTMAELNAYAEADYSSCCWGWVADPGSSGATTSGKIGFLMYSSATTNAVEGGCGGPGGGIRMSDNVLHTATYAAHCCR